MVRAGMAGESDRSGRSAPRNGLTSQTGNRRHGRDSAEVQEESHSEVDPKSV